MQGRPIKQLHYKWRNYKYDSNIDNIKVYTSDVKQTASELNQSDKAILNLIKACMSWDAHGSL